MSLCFGNEIVSTENNLHVIYDSGTTQIVTSSFDKNDYVRHRYTREFQSLTEQAITISRFKREHSERSRQHNPSKSIWNYRDIGFICWNCEYIIQRRVRAFIWSKISGLIASNRLSINLCKLINEVPGQSTNSQNEQVHFRNVSNDDNDNYYLPTTVKREMKFLSPIRSHSPQCAFRSSMLCWYNT